MGLSDRGPGLLSHLKVLELDGGVSTSYAGRVLADLGARVTRVESAKTPDSLRRRGESSRGQDATPGALFAALNFRKELVSVDSAGLLDDPAFLDLAREADILLAGRTSLSDQQIGALILENPRIVVALASTCGERFGDDGWMHLHASAISGVSALIGHRDRMPLPPPFELALYPVGANLAAAALAANFGAVAGGNGQVVQVDASGVLFSFMWTASMISNLSTDRFARNGRRFPGSGGAYPFALFPCADGYVACIGRSTKDWRTLVEMMGSPAWAEDERFQDPVVIAREWADEVDGHVIAWLEQHTRSELFAQARRAGFPLAPVSRVSEVLDVEQFNLRGSISPDLDIDGREVRMLRYPYHFSERVDGAADSTPAHTEATRGARSIFSGLRVLDLSWVWSGPMVGAALADLGADVIKLENPDRLDNARLRGRPIRDGKPMEGPILELSQYFHQNNRGKRSVLLDFKDPAGAEVFRQLVRVSDVVLENLTPGVFDRAGVGYEDVVGDNPGLIWMAASAVGATGPLVGLRAYAPIMSSFAGIEGLVGYEDDPVVGMLGCGLGDANAGSHALFALVAALVARQHDGRGRYVDMSQIEAAAAILIEPLAEAQLRGEDPTAMGVRHPDVAPHGHYPCAGEDQWVAITALDDDMWKRLAGVIGGSDLAGDPRFAAAADRMNRRAEIDSMISGWTRLHTREAVVTCLSMNSVAATPVFQVTDTEALFSRYLERVDHPVTGRESLSRVPWLLGGTPAKISRPAPLVGEHTDPILRDWLGMGDSERAGYIARFDGPIPR